METRFFYFFTKISNAVAWL